MRNKILESIVVTGGNGRFAKVLKKTNLKHKIYFPDKTKLNILKIQSIRSFLKKKKPKYLIHTAGLSRPMDLHNKDIKRSIDLNIIGTCNIVKVCSEQRIKLIYFSTGYVYQGKKGNYSEKDPVLPINNYAWSKLGGECAVKLYSNSLILRITMCEKPFVHQKAFYDIKTNFIFHEDVAKMIPKILNEVGILNIGGKTQSVYDFVKKTNKKVKKISGIKFFPPNPSMNLNNLRKILKK